MTNCVLCAIINTEIEKQLIKRKDMIRMKKYSVVVELPAFAVVEIEAESAEEAESLAWDKVG